MRAGTGEVSQAGRTSEEAALDALELDYGDSYLIGHHEAHGWWAERRDRVGVLLETGTPDELRNAMAEDHELKPVALWCPHCGQRVVFAGCAAVHAATFTRSGPDGHTAHAVGEEPPLWKAAREIEADYGGAFRVTARFGILRADWTAEAIGRGVTAAHYEAPGEEGLRRQLDEAACGVQWGQARERAEGAP
jgi:hypothetical protein